MPHPQGRGGVLQEALGKRALSEIFAEKAPVFLCHRQSSGLCLCEGFMPHLSLGFCTSSVHSDFDQG